MNNNINRSTKGFQFTPVGIAGILKRYRLQVPTYQREYSWTTDQVQTLYDDFSRAKNENSDYFLGTIVTIKRGQNDSLEIVDGQQRLTTTSLLIVAIRDYFREICQTEMVIESINNDYLSTFDRRQETRVSRLVLNIDDRAYYDKLLAGNIDGPRRESHARLNGASRKAKEHVRKIVSVFAEKDHVTILNDWLEFLEHSATVILVESQDGAQAFKMFETLNDRGLKTSQADLVKSYLFGQAGSRIDEAQARWSSMKDNLEEIDDDDRAINFLRHAIIATQEFVRTDGVYDYAQKIKGESNSARFLGELERLSRVYVATYNHASTYWESYPTNCQRALVALNKINIKPLRPLVLSLAISFAQDEITPALQLLVSVSVRMIIAGNARSGSIESAVASSAAKIYAKNIVTAKAVKDSIKPLIVSDADFRDGFAQLRVSRADLARYYLRALESTESQKEEPWYIPNDDPAILTLEHVMPRNATPEKWPNVDEETKRSCVKRLGNMCLLNKSANNALGDVDFLTKRTVLSQTPFVLTNMIAKENDWDLSAIERRQAKMAEIAVKTWPI